MAESWCHYFQMPLTVAGQVVKDTVRWDIFACQDIDHKCTGPSCITYCHTAKPPAQAYCCVSKNTHTQAFYGSLDFVQDNPGELVPEETFTQLHLLWSSIVPYLLHPSNMIHGILLVQSTCLTVFFHNLQVFFGTSWPDTLHFILHTFLHPIIVFFLQLMPIPLQSVLL